jgi:hypothetical protein
MLKSDLEACSIEIKELKQRLDHSSRCKVFSPPCEVCGALKGKLLYAIKENSKLKQEVAYLFSHLERTIVSEQMIEDDLSQVEESATKSTYKLGVGFERCEDKGEKSPPKFVPSSNYHKEEEALKPIKTQYPSNPKPSFNPMRGVKKNTPNLGEEVYICIFCGCAGHSDGFCFQRKRMEKSPVDYARNSYHDEFLDFLPRFSSRALSHFSHGPNHRSYAFGSQESGFVPRCFGVDPRSHHGVHPLHRLGFPDRGVYSHFEPSHFDGPCFPCHGSRPTHSNGEAQRMVKTSSGRMVKCWIPKIFLTNPNIEPSTFSHSM